MIEEKDARQMEIRKFIEENLSISVEEDYFYFDKKSIKISLRMDGKIISSDYLEIRDSCSS